MDIHIWICRYPKSHIDNRPFRYLYKSMDIHTKVTIPDEPVSGHRENNKVSQVVQARMQHIATNQLELS